jgi:hypothetical protein
VLGHPNARQVELPQLPRPLDPEEAGRFRRSSGRRRWISFRSCITLASMKSRSEPDADTEFSLSSEAVTRRLINRAIALRRLR